jgi:hypothetical protein
VPPPTAVFIHASVGIFKKKKPVGTNETWGYGREIMEEIIRDAQVRADCQTFGADGEPLLDLESARDVIGYDNTQIQQRLEKKELQRAKVFSLQWYIAVLWMVV